MTRARKPRSRFIAQIPASITEDPARDYREKQAIIASAKAEVSRARDDGRRHSELLEASAHCGVVSMCIEKLP